MIKEFKLLVLFALGLILSGCLFYNNPQMSYYDINQIKTTDSEFAPLKASVRFRQIRNLTPVGNNFIYSGSDGRQVVDCVNAWIQSPDQMILRKMANLIACENNENVMCDISGVLYDFVINEDNHSCTIAMKFNVKIIGIADKAKDLELHYSVTKEFGHNSSASAYAVTMAEIVADIAAELQKKLKNFIDK